MQLFNYFYFFDYIFIICFTYCHIWNCLDLIQIILLTFLSLLISILFLSNAGAGVLTHADGREDCFTWRNDEPIDDDAWYHYYRVYVYIQCM